MFLNHEGHSVYDASGPDVSPRYISLCPSCQRPLAAKRGELKIWHWAHKADPTHSCDHAAGETQWHLRWKAVFVQLGWRVERAYEVDHPDYRGTRFVFDAVTGHGKTATHVFEFVHSLSDSYAHKSKAIVADRIDLTWVFDGASLSASRKSYKGWQGKRVQYNWLLKPKAFALSQSLAGNVFVHHEGYFWKHWWQNIWHRVDRPDSDDSLESRFAKFNPDDLKRSRKVDVA